MRVTYPLPRSPLRVKMSVLVVSAGRLAGDPNEAHSQNADKARHRAGIFGV
jgi:hypothetical protein